MHYLSIKLGRSCLKNHSVLWYRRHHTPKYNFDLARRHKSTVQVHTYTPGKHTTYYIGFNRLTSTAAGEDAVYTRIHIYIHIIYYYAHCTRLCINIRHIYYSIKIVVFFLRIRYV